MPWTIKGLEKWLERQASDTKRKFRKYADIYDRSLYLIQLKDLWKHIELRIPLPVSTIETLPETPESRRQRLEEQKRDTAIDALPTWKREKILQHKRPDTANPRRKGARSKPPLPFPLYTRTI